MKTKLNCSLLALVLLTFSIVDSQLFTAHAQGTAFTYQGKLNDGTVPANGNYDLQFSLFNTNQTGSPIALILTNIAVPVNNGLFTTTLDFGNGVFTGSNVWVELGVRTNGNGAFVTLAPRQAVTPTPYAITAANLAGVVENNTIQGAAAFATIGGGLTNVIQSSASYSGIFGGAGNSESAPLDFIGGGQRNSIQAGADRSVIAGGNFNTIQLNSSSSVIGGGQVNAIQMNAGVSVIGGGSNNNIQTNAGGSVIAGGVQNNIQTNAMEAAIGGGVFNTIQIFSGWSVIGGGFGNTIQSNAEYAFIGSGFENTIQDNNGQSAIVGGNQNIIQTNAYDSVISGGAFNVIGTNALGSALGGGILNTNGGILSTVPGGSQNFAGGDYSFAAGRQAQAFHQGSFVWADSQNAPFASTRDDQFSIRAAGGVVMNISGSAGLNPPAVAINSSSATGIGLVINQNSSDTTALFANGGTGDIIKGFSGVGNTVFRVKNNGAVGIGRSTLPVHLIEIGNGATPAYCDGTIWQNGSDRNSKADFTAISPSAVLKKVSELPITEWRYKVEATGTEHLGPMAQDFHAAFGLNGADDTHISTIDEEGVALAAIQGLNQKVEEKDSEIQNLKEENSSLEKRLSELEAEFRLLADRK